jgi:hypothetical protein
MIMVKTWRKWIKGDAYMYKGWFILGIIPIFIVRTEA